MIRWDAYTFTGGSFVKLNLLPFWKGKVLFSKERTCSQREKILSFFRVDPFQKGLGVQESKQKVTKVVFIVKTGGILSSPLNTVLHLTLLIGGLPLLPSPAAPLPFLICPLFSTPDKKNPTFCWKIHETRDQNQKSYQCLKVSFMCILVWGI